MGAAIQGGVITGDVKTLLTATPLSRYRNNGRIYAHRPQHYYSTSKSQVFSTALNNQPAVDIHVLQGRSAMAAVTRHLDVLIDRYPVELLKSVTFDIDKTYRVC